MRRNTLVSATLCLPKIAYSSRRAVNAVALTLEIREDDAGSAHLSSVDLSPVLGHRELAICGNIWNGPHSDIVSGGQNIEEIAELFPADARVQRIAAIWRQWHLNGMQAGTDAQKAILDEPENRARLNASRLDHYPTCLSILAERGLLVDRGYRYGTLWLVKHLPREVEVEICELFGHIAPAPLTAPDTTEAALESVTWLLSKLETPAAE